MDSKIEAQPLWQEHTRNRLLTVRMGWRSILAREARDFLRAWASTWRGAELFLNRRKWGCLISIMLVLATAWQLHPLDAAWNQDIHLIKQTRLFKNLKFPKKKPEARHYQFWSGEHGFWGEMIPRIDPWKPGEMMHEKPQKPGRKPGKDAEWERWAARLSFWGDVTQYNLGLFGCLWMAGRLRKSPRLRRIALCLLVAPALAGLVTNDFRAFLGRPRPKEALARQVEDQLTGINFSMRYHSFPSSHCATVFGAAVPLLILVPAAGIPATLFAGSVAWARLYSGNHYPTDVLVGSFAGVLFGVACAWPLRRKMRRIQRWSSARECRLPE